MKTNRTINHLLALSLCVTFFTTISIVYDFYYDLNDDIMLKNIISGIYTGTPEGHSVYILFPLSFLLSLLYRLHNGIPWFGIFLFCCQAGSLYFITVRVLSFVNGLSRKTVIILLEAGILISLLIQHFIFIQYTVTSAMLAGAAIFLFCTADTRQSAKVFLCQNIGTILLAVLSFLLRYQMFLLILPLFCITGAYRWTQEACIFTRQNAIKYFSPFALLLAGMICSQLIHLSAYNVNDWKEYFSYNDQRTQLYDYQQVPPYVENEAFYTSIGLTHNEELLLENYNIGIDENIDADILGSVAAYSADLSAGTFAETVRVVLSEYLHQTLSRTAYPWNIFILFLYSSVLAVMVFRRNLYGLTTLIGMCFVRTGLWFYIIYNGRTPTRITDSLNLTEFLVLMGMILIECRAKENWKRFKIFLVLVLTALSLLNFRPCLASLQAEIPLRETADSKLTALQTYTKQHHNAFYFVDLFSLSAYSEKVFTHTDHSLANYDLMGGWMIKSPLMYQKYALYDIDSIGNALLNRENVYVIVQAPESVWRPPLSDWLQAYYNERSSQVLVEKVDCILLDGEEIFSVYAVSLQK